MGDVLYISPHADDVAFSAAGQLAREVAAGARATVMTLFEPPEAEAEVRRGEDEAFARAFGVTLVRGEWSDAVVRRRRYRSPAQLFTPMRADEAPLVEAIRAALQARVDAGARRVVAPLGVGGHVDHQVAHAACRALVGADVAYYEDTPYVLTPFQLPRRLARLDAAVVKAEIDERDETLARGSVRSELRAAAATWMAAPFIQERVGPKLRKLAVAAILMPEWTRWPRRSRTGARRLSATLIAGDDLPRAKLEAIAAYPSQWRLFYRALDDWRGELERYARAMGQAGMVERVWREVRPAGP
ncbi:MAG TPA: PIG-L family deacetylase [Polyangia bacterium]|nr:PIG-L family deacetylase [Polyangia bacterium]